MATHYALPAGYVLTASIFDGSGYVRQVEDENVASIVTNAAPVSFGPYLVPRQFIATGAVVISIDPIDNQGEVVAALDPHASATANGTTLAAAIVAANRVNGFVKLPGGRYPMKCAITTGCQIEWAPDTVLLQEQRESVLNVHLGADSKGPHAITGWSITKHTNNAGASTAKFLRLTMAAEDAENYQVGDSIMVCSRDARAYYTGATNYAGEMAFVAAVEAASGYVYLDGTLYLYGVGTLYTTTPVAYRLSRQTVRLIRPQVEANGDVYQTGLGGTLWAGSIELTAVARPRLENVRVNSAWSAAIYLRSCSMPNVTIDHIRDCPGDPDGSRYGYGVMLRGACNGGNVSGGITERCRHAFTTDCRQSSSWSLVNLWDHGDVTDTTVRGITSVGGGGVQFDTHENSIATAFVDCTAVGSRYDVSRTSTTGVGFNLRGPWDSVYNCRAMDTEGGVQVDVAGIINEIVGDNVIDGFQWYGERTNGLAGYGIYVDGSTDETTPQRVSIRNLRPGAGSRGVYIHGEFTGIVTIDSCIFRGMYDTQVRVQGSCTLDVCNTVFDMSDANTGELCISLDNNNTVAISLANVSVRSKNATTPTALVSAASGCTANIRHMNCGELSANGTVLSGGAGTINKTAITVFS